MKPAHTRQPVPFERRGADAPRTPYKPKAWNHQDDLKAGVGKPITLFLNDSTCVEGILQAADQFTIKVLLTAPQGKSPLTFSKHAIQSYGLKA